jgi:hypothetical protein
MRIKASERGNHAAIGSAKALPPDGERSEGRRRDQDADGDAADTDDADAAVQAAAAPGTGIIVDKKA